MNSSGSGRVENLVLGLGEPLIAPLVPPPLRDDVMLLWALDRRLAELARSGKEPVLRQIKLRWWSEQLAAVSVDAVPADPLLGMIAGRLTDRIDGVELMALADAWECEALGEVDASGERGERLFLLTARLLGRTDTNSASAGRLWALVDQAMLADGEAASRLWSTATALLVQIDLTRLPRPLAAVAALAMTVARQKGVRSRWREQLVVFRVGVIGR